MEIDMRTSTETSKATASRLCHWLTAIYGGKPDAKDRAKLRQHIDKYGFTEAKSCADIAFRKYYTGDRYTWKLAIDYIERVHKVRNADNAKHLRKALYLRGILRRRFGPCIDASIVNDIAHALENGYPYGKALKLAKETDGVGPFRERILKRKRRTP